MFTCKRFRLISLASYLLTVQLLAGCGAGNAKETEVKNYTSISCPSDPNAKLTKNIVSLASGYYIFNKTRIKPDFAEVNLKEKYATGRTEILSDVLARTVTDRLGYDGLSSYNVKLISLLELPERVVENQTLKLSQSCQINNALLDNEKLRGEPSGAFYILASKKSFIVLRDGSYTPNPATALKFKLLNPRTNQVEEAVFSLGEIVGDSSSGDSVSAPSTFLDQVQERIQNWGKGDEAKAESKKWSIKQHIKIPYNQSYPYYTAVKESVGGGEPVVGEIQSIEFVQGERIRS